MAYTILLLIDQSTSPLRLSLNNLSPHGSTRTPNRRTHSCLILLALISKRGDDRLLTASSCVVNPHIASLIQTIALRLYCLVLFFTFP